MKRQIVFLNIKNVRRRTLHF